ncbi:hypothetical protein N7495_003932 [Penicillium taxi]|uniref:uncharacterized protein n=1 Tax=Penicillium taxi TaxID=168475 RepID=UPI002544E55B|nr:uncharacterized protein N7495_003932 [Penicillium taxi]KAJ5899188.1 hypothetical protein N7495_003932 [Penicillium taxi]
MSSHGRNARARSSSPTTQTILWLGCLVFVLTVIETYSHFTAHPDVSFIRWICHQDHKNHRVIRPGQYRETTSHQYAVNNPDDNIEDEDEDYGMGTEHDERDPLFYMGGTLTLTSTHSTDLDHPHPIPSIYDPYPAYNSKEWRKKNHGDFKACLGPRGRDLDRISSEDMMLVYKGKQDGFPSPKIGSYEAMDLDGDVCADKYSRFGAYGFDEDETEEIPGFTRPPMVSWYDVDWHKLQSQCFERNINRYAPSSLTEQSYQQPLSFELREPPKKMDGSDTASSLKPYHPRSALLIRTWHEMLWTKNHREYLRALIMELSLHSGAEYEVFILVHVKDDELPMFSDPKTVAQLKKSIPQEFRNMAVFFNNKLLEAWYPKIPEHTPIYQHHQPLQIFAQLYPNFEYYWQLEMDGRHTGHTYHFLDKAISFARDQPRKYLWERNAYFYVPGAHGPWENFTQMVDEELKDKSNSTVWGPIGGTGIRPQGPEAPVSPDSDNYTWGVGEEADFITFLPIFNPKDTQWTFPDMVWNFRNGLDTPRRAAVITMGRYSRRLLDLIHQAQATRGLGLVSEMTGASWALYHGLKAVHVPHPIYADGKWTPRELARIYNRGEADNINGGDDSIWNWDHLYDHIMYRLSYMFTTHTAEDLYRRWMGYRTAAGEGGKTSSELRYGRHCFPSMFLHTVKNAEMGIVGNSKAVP